MVNWYGMVNWNGNGNLNNFNIKIIPFKSEIMQDENAQSLWHVLVKRHSIQSRTLQSHADNLHPLNWHSVKVHPSAHTGYSHHTYCTVRAKGLES